MTDRGEAGAEMSCRRRWRPDDRNVPAPVDAPNPSWVGYATADAGQPTRDRVTGSNDLRPCDWENAPASALS